MATEMQKAAVEKLVELHGKSVSRAMRESKLPYTDKSAKNPRNLTQSKGFKELMTQYGLTEGLITKALVSDIKSKPKKRFLELSLGAEILGMKKQDVQPGVTNNFIQIVIKKPDGQDSRNITDDKAV